jgi:hypothetical protein
MYEAQAAELIPEGKSSEPTRSILYRSAASLAYQCKEFSIAVRLIAKGLSGFPTPQIEQELKDLYEQISFEDHLQVRGVTLADEDFQLSMRGKSVGLGTIFYDEFLRRIRATRTIVERTVQRIMGATYQRYGQVLKVYRPFVPVLSTAEQHSFAITIKLGVAKNEPFPLFVNASQVIDEVLINIELVNNSEENKLRKKIQQNDYYQNFLAMTLEIAPDGDKINFVGFISARRTVSLTRKRMEIEIPPEVEKSDVERTQIRVEGVLDYATARKQSEAIGLTTEECDEYNIIVQEGLDDLVRSYFRQR